MQSKAELSQRAATQCNCVSGQVLGCSCLLGRLREDLCLMDLLWCVCCLQADNNLSLIEYELVTIPAEQAAAAQPATA